MPGGTLECMLERGLAQLVAEAIGLPSWAPKLLKRAALVLLLFTLYFMRPVFTEGLMIFAHERAEQMQKLMQPFLDHLVDGMTPATPEPTVTN